MTGGRRITAPSEIEPASLAIVSGLLAEDTRFSDAEMAVATRLVHASGDPGLATAIAFSPDATDAGIAALAAGADVASDVRMVAVGVDVGRLSLLGGKVRCMVDDPAVVSDAARAGRTRSATAMRAMRGALAGAVIAIGNAPTALREVLALADEGVRPALVVGMPVGFVDAAESKEALTLSGLPYVTVRGTRGGSPLAAAAVNALLRLAEAGAPR